MKVLWVEDHARAGELLAAAAAAASRRRFGIDLVIATSLLDAERKLRLERFDLVVTDLRLGGKRDGGLQVMALAGMLSPDAMVLVLTAYPDDSNRQASFRLGALHFLEKPVDLATIAQHAATVGVRSAFTPAPQG